jgi:hypothetical protein
MIVNSWKLTGVVRETIINHHQNLEEEAPHRDVLFNVAAANYFAVSREFGFSGDRWPEEISPLVWEALGIGPDVFDRIAAEVSQEIEKARIFLML